jgi:hypothetical protein
MDQLHTYETDIGRAGSSDWHHLRAIRIAECQPSLLLQRNLIGGFPVENGVVLTIT